MIESTSVGGRKRKLILNPALSKSDPPLIDMEPHPLKRPYPPNRNVGSPVAEVAEVVAAPDETQKES